MTAHRITNRTAITTKNTALIASTLGSGIVFLDGTIVNVALPAIRASLHGGLAVQGRDEHRAA